MTSSCLFAILENKADEYVNHAHLSQNLFIFDRNEKKIKKTKKLNLHIKKIRYMFKINRKQRKQKWYDRLSTLKHYKSIKTTFLMVKILLVYTHYG